ncbi:hypothetical protein F9C07_7547 [Aspergillus flavus]|uniref:Uncharacterized protein n=1 Tax=Aspergillus flavus (strain ATCC 200026 / FGSC A1120 / IAM 13836 / NRRL 3357 / JCM 12722 / SRRC 167) TaxID=332952 RepID=A0A7U2MN02_ASPFN|nr:hypothetical protein F9C07_7547 [Aspergillus flavus]
MEHTGLNDLRAVKSSSILFNLRVANSIPVDAFRGAVTWDIPPACPGKQYLGVVSTAAREEKQHDSGRIGSKRGNASTPDTNNDPNLEE